jgi:hypothetical protein
MLVLQMRDDVVGFLAGDAEFVQHFFPVRERLAGFFRSLVCHRHPISPISAPFSVLYKLFSTSVMHSSKTFAANAACC